MMFRFSRPDPVGVLGAAGIVGLSLPLPWILPPPLAVQLVVWVIVAGHGYAAAVLVRFVWRRLGALGRPARPLHCGSVSRRPRSSRRSAVVGVRTSAARLLAVMAVLGLLVSACLPLTAAGSVPPVSWGTLGREGQVFLAGGPDAATIGQVSGNPARQPVRAYVGLRSASTAEQRARLAVAELDRQGAFTRSAILVVVPTGSGWVDPAAVASLEYLTRGDLATVAVQYAELPSWAEYLRGSARAEHAAATVLTALRQRLDVIAAPDRPRLLVYGESLGAIAARSAGSGAGSGVDAALLVGQPGAVWSSLPQRGSTTFVHADDPVGWWSPRLLVQRPEGWPGPWLPVVSFWQVTGSLLTALDAPAGHGHHYGAELVDAWRSTDPNGPAGRLPTGRLAAVRCALTVPSHQLAEIC